MYSIFLLHYFNKKTKQKIKKRIQNLNLKIQKQTSKYFHCSLHLAGCYCGVFRSYLLAFVDNFKVQRCFIVSLLLDFFFFFCYDQKLFKAWEFYLFFNFFFLICMFTFNFNLNFLIKFKKTIKSNQFKSILKQNVFKIQKEARKIQCQFH